MAKVGRIAEANEKRLDIGRFLPEEVREKNEDGTFKDDYVTIKKLPYQFKKKVEFISMNSFTGKAGKSLFKKIVNKGIDTQKLESMTQSEKLEMFLDMNMNTEEERLVNDMTIEMAQIILDNGLVPDKHSFTDDAGKPITANFEFFSTFGNSILIDFLITQIREFSKGYSLGE